ncbi:MAG TPA: hypothetical protein ENJ28_10910 [Gammaproteobacteria bacterium]|nr:hypothetical protein [Gammaproteobacteria bacterium]
MKKFHDEKALWVVGSMIVLMLVPVVFIMGLIVGINIDSTATLTQDNLSSWVTAFATVVIAVLTIVLAKETWSLRNIQLSQIEHIRKDSIRPNIDLYLKSSPAAFNFVDVHVINNGSGSAQNVTFSFENRNTKDTEVFDYVVSLFTKLNILNSGISSLGINEKRSSFVLNFIELNQKYKDIIFETNIVVNISYEDIEGDKYTSKAIMNFSEFLGITELGGGDPMYKIASSIEKFQKDFNSFSKGSSSSKIKVDTYTAKDRKEAEEAMLKRIEEQRASQNNG